LEITSKTYIFFTFEYLKGDKKIIGIEEALVTWEVLLKDKNWPLTTKWLNFLKAENKKAISRDTWQQLLEFMTAYPVNLEKYDSSSWPSIFDEFNEYMQKNK